MPAECDLSVIVVTHNGRAAAVETLRSARSAAGDVDVEWMVVDSGSQDGTPEEIRRRWSDVAVIRYPNIGFAAANNMALARARGRWVLLLNPDVEVAQGTFAELVAALDRRPEVGVASVVQLGPDARPQDSIRAFPSPRRQLGEALLASRWPAGIRRFASEIAPAESLEERSADWLTGAFLIARREAVETVGRLDERFFMYSEETDWCYRMKRAGWDVRHLPVMSVVHHGGTHERPELRAQLTHSKILFAHKHLSRPSALAIRTCLALGHLLRLVALTPTVIRRSPASRRRVRGEWNGLRVALGARGGRPGEAG